MTYSLESYYYCDPAFPRKKAELITVQVLSQWAVHYEARLIAPHKGMAKEARKGDLSRTNKKENRQTITDIVQWIHDSSSVSDLFYLLLYEQYPVQDAQSCALFDHHDTATASWVLELNDEQFSVLQKELKANDLPADLFYPSGSSKSVPFKFLGVPFGSLYYSPKEWEAYQAKQKEKSNI